MFSLRPPSSNNPGPNIHQKAASIVVAGFLFLGVPSTSNGGKSFPEHGADVFTTSDNVRFKVETIATGLAIPWSLAFEGKDLFFTERRGKLWLMRNSVGAPTLVADVGDVYGYGEGGLMGLAFHPHFKENSFIYLSYSYELDGRTFNKVERFTLANGRLRSSRIIIGGLPGGGIHNGCRIKFGPDAKLYVTTGDAAHREIAQDTNSLGGKILRLNDDGSIPVDNPFRDSPVYTLGHRNGQGLSWHPSFGLLFESEHGPSGFDGPGGGDEINVIEAGKNYGWPTIHHREHADGMVSPVAEFTPAVAPSGATFCSGTLFAGFRNNLFVATLVGKRLLRVRLDSTNGRTVVGIEGLLESRYGRMRDVVEGPDGALYLCTSNRDGRGSPVETDDRILKITPIFE